MAAGDRDPIEIENADGAGAFVIVCDHASQTVPLDYASLGLAPEVLDRHIAWDPGALGVARQMAADLDAPLLWPDVSRLVIDCNRDPAAPDLIVAEGDGIPVPGNRDLDTAERTRRLAAVHAPYHAAIEACLAARRAAGRQTSLIAVHSFTPVWRDRHRPWQIGILFDDDRRLADTLIGALRADPALTVGVNEPYSPADRVYYTLSRHRAQDSLAAVMLEIRNDEIADATAQRQWGTRLAAVVRDFAVAGQAAAGPAAA